MADFNLLPERYAEHKAEVDFELNIFRRFPKMKAYYEDIVKRGLKVTNEPNSWVAWAIGITDEKPSGKMVVDSPSPPDIDLDFSDRDPVVDYLFSTYGEDRTAMVGTFLQIKTKYALKDIARWHNGGHLTNEDPIHKITRTIETAPQLYKSEKDFLLGFTDETGVEHPGHLDGNPELRRYLDLNPEIKDLLFKILEKPRSMGKHAGGIIITPGPIDEVIPTRYFDGKKCTQISHTILEKIGGMKIDILGVNTLNWIWDTIWLVKDRHGVTLDPWNLPDDPEVWKMVGNGDVETVFQFDTNTVIPFIKRIKPSRIHDLILITSICRPGGLDSTLEDGDTVAEHFVNRYTGKEPTSFLDPILEPILRDTYGLVVFQEQIQSIFEVVGGFNPIEADLARRAIGKKKLDLINSLQGQLFGHATKVHGWTLQKCEALWQSFIGAANYSFNRAHACAYAIIAYACAYLKKNHLLEWWRSVLSYAPNEKIQEYLPSINSFVSYPHINRPAHKWFIDEDKIIAPTSLVRSVGQKSVDEIIERRNQGEFTSFVDFSSRIVKQKVNKTVVTNLILAGCFNGLPVVDGGAPEDSMGPFLAKLYELRDEELPDTYKDLDPMRSLGLRKAVLPIFTINVVKEFLPIIKAQSDFSIFRNLPCLSGNPIVSNYSKFAQVSSSWSGDVTLIGVVESAEMFHFVSKSGKNVGKKVGALRVCLENDGRKAEFVVWSDTLAKIDRKELAAGKLVACFGPLKYSSYRDEVEFKLNSVRVLM
jgi:DNA polymerase III alpha subunit